MQKQRNNWMCRRERCRVCVWDRKIVLHGWWDISFYQSFETIGYCSHITVRSVNVRISMFIINALININYPLGISFKTFRIGLPSFDSASVHVSTVFRASGLPLLIFYFPYHACAVSPTFPQHTMNGLSPTKFSLPLQNLFAYTIQFPPTQ